MKRIVFLSLITINCCIHNLLITTVYAQKNDHIDRIDPPNWWVGMQNKELNIIVKGANIASYNNLTISPAGITIAKIEKSESKDYLFVNLIIGNNAIASTYELTFQNGDKKIKYNYDLLKKNIDPNNMLGLNSADLLYLIMPDRFANGNLKNDVAANYNESTINRDSILTRHGGDIEGIIKQLDYLNDIGATALWLNPVQENNQPKESYHGYAITDHYKIDGRLGTLDDYKNLVQKAKQKNIKIIMDMVFNHVGNEHYFFKNKPSEDWFHYFKQFTRTNYRATTVMDPYASNYDKNLMQNGWFDKHMPDLNQQNTHLADYLIYNSIWWIETTAINGFRIDTWAYPDQAFMKKWTNAVLNEYPKFTIFGEVWEHGPAIQAQFANNIYDPKYKGVMPGIIDFELYYAINDALTKEFGWTEGAAKIYYTLAQDFLYKDATNNIIFLDNHDLSRFTSMIEGNLDKFKSGIAFLLTSRGTPSLFYGTEILMKAWSNPDAKVRIDFPGGWPNDTINKFKITGRNGRENEAFEYIKKLANYRKNCKAITEGKLMQFVPENGIYTYFRYTEKQKIMVIMNTSNKDVEHETTRYTEMLSGCSSAINVVTENKLDNIGIIKLKANSTLIIELLK